MDPHPQAELPKVPACSPDPQNVCQLALEGDQPEGTGRPSSRDTSPTRDAGITGERSRDNENDMAQPYLEKISTTVPRSKAER